MLNINELKKYNEEREKLKLEPYNLILEIICNKIKESSILLGINYCLYQVPEFMLGYTSYDVIDCSKWLQTKLSEMGITNVEIFGNNIMLIIWSH